MHQLPFYGKKTRPRALRRDLWRPFASVTLPPSLHSSPSSPPTADGDTQYDPRVNTPALAHDPNFADGLRLFQTLREMRTLRDYAWKTIPHMRDAVMSKQADGRKAMMGRLMDQRATAVADLARALWLRMDWVQQRRVEKERQRGELQKLYDDKWKKVERLAEGVADGRVEALGKGIEKNEAMLQSLSDAGAKEDDTLKVRRKLFEMRTQRNRMLRCKDAVDHVKGVSIPEDRKEKWSKTLRTLILVQKEGLESIPSKPVEKAIEKAKAGVVKTIMQNEESNSTDTLTAASDTGLGVPAATSDGEQSAEDIFVKRSGWGSPEDQFLERRRYVWKIKGTKFYSDTHYISYPKGEDITVPSNAIKIKWLDIRDAQYARSWPLDVYHARMGLLGYHTKYTMPHPDSGAIMEVEAMPEEEQTEEFDDAYSEPPSKEMQEKKSMWSRIISLPSNIFGRVFRSRA